MRPWQACRLMQTGQAHYQQYDYCSQHGNILVNIQIRLKSDINSTREGMTSLQRLRSWSPYQHYDYSNYHHHRSSSGIHKMSDGIKSTTPSRPWPACTAKQPGQGLTTITKMIATIIVTSLPWHTKHLKMKVNNTCEAIKQSHSHGYCSGSHYQYHDRKTIFIIVQLKIKSFWIISQ